MNNTNNKTSAPQGGDMRLYAAITKAYAENVRMMREELRHTQRQYRMMRAIVCAVAAVAILALMLAVWIALTY